VVVFTEFSVFGSLVGQRVIPVCVFCVVCLLFVLLSIGCVSSRESLSALDSESDSSLTAGEVVDWRTGPYGRAIGPDFELAGESRLGSFGVWDRFDFVFGGEFYFSLKCVRSAHAEKLCSIRLESARINGGERSIVDLPLINVFSKARPSICFGGSSSLFVSVLRADESGAETQVFRDVHRVDFAHGECRVIWSRSVVCPCPRLASVDLIDFYLWQGGVLDAVDDLHWCEGRVYVADSLSQRILVFGEKGGETLDVVSFAPNSLGAAERSLFLAAVVEEEEKEEEEEEEEGVWVWWRRTGVTGESSVAHSDSNHGIVGGGQVVALPIRGGNRVFSFERMVMVGDGARFSVLLSW
jgi:hypothetical protein